MNEDNITRPIVDLPDYELLRKIRIFIDKLFMYRFEKYCCLLNIFGHILDLTPVDYANSIVFQVKKRLLEHGISCITPDDIVFMLANTQKLPRLEQEYRNTLVKLVTELNYWPDVCALIHNGEKKLYFTLDVLYYNWHRQNRELIPLLVKENIKFVTKLHEETRHKVYAVIVLKNVPFLLRIHQKILKKIPELEQFVKLGNNEQVRTRLVIAGTTLLGVEDEITSELLALLIAHQN